MTPQDKADGGRGDGLFGWVRENWDEPSGVGKAKLAAIAVLLLLFVALFGEDDGVPRSDPAAQAPATAVVGQHGADATAGAAPDVSATPPSRADEPAPVMATRHPPGGPAEEGLPPHAYVTEPVLPGAVDVPLITTTDTPLVPGLLDARPALPPASLATDDTADLLAENARLQAALDASEARVQALEKALQDARAGPADADREGLKAEVDALRQRLNELLDQLRDTLEAKSAPAATPASASL